MEPSNVIWISLMVLLMSVGSCHCARPGPKTQSQTNNLSAAAAAAAQLPAAAANRRSLQQVPVGAIVGGVQAGVDLGINAVAPLVNNIASNIPIMVPSFQGRCMNGEPVAPIQNKPDQIWCIVASGAQLTDGFFRAFSGLTSMAGNMAGMFMGR